MSELLKEFKQYLRENEESYKNGARDSIEYPLGYEEVKLLLNEIERLHSIIKEAREYMRTLYDEYASDDYDIKCDVFNKIFYEILDKENK